MGQEGPGVHCVRAALVGCLDLEWACAGVGLGVYCVWAFLAGWLDWVQVWLSCVVRQCVASCGVCGCCCSTLFQCCLSLAARAGMGIVRRAWVFLGGKAGTVWSRSLVLVWAAFVSQLEHMDPTLFTLSK